MVKKTNRGLPMPWWGFKMGVDFSHALVCNSMHGNVFFWRWASLPLCGIKMGALTCVQFYAPKPKCILWDLGLVGLHAIPCLIGVGSIWEGLTPSGWNQCGA